MARNFKPFILLATLGLAGQAQADFCDTNTLLVMGPSWHSKSEIKGNDVHNDTFGLGFGCEVGLDWTLYAGVYRNSFRDLSVFSAGVWSGGFFRDLEQTTGIKLGLGAGLASGYDRQVAPLQVRGVSPMGFLSVQLLQVDAVDVGVILVPPGESDGSWVVNFHVQVGL